MSAHDLTAEVERLVVEALETPYSSFSATDDSETGNRYQAVGLGHRTTRGLREDRSRFLDVLDLRGRTVLDLGSNLGEISRAARARGAALVDGFEIDPYFNEVAQLVNVLTGTTRVSFFERDMADPSTYDEPYDVVLAFSAFRFIAGCIDRLAAITDVLLVETHELKGNFDERYLGPLTEHFPAFRMLGESDAERLRAAGVRAVGLFARDEAALEASLAPRLRGGGRAAGAQAAGVRVRRIGGAIDQLELDGARVRIDGWCRDPDTPHDTVELSTTAAGPAGAPFGVLGVAEPASGGRFAFDCEAPLADAALVRLDVSAFAGPEALGTMSAYWSPALAEAEDRLPGLQVAHGLLEPLARYRALESFESALDRGADTSLIEPFLHSLLPHARIGTGAGADDSCDLVIGHGVTALEPSLRELHRIARAGGYVTLGVPGGLARSFGEPGLDRDRMIALCARDFDVISHVPGGVAGLHDVIVLRRP